MREDRDAGVAIYVVAPIFKSITTLVAMQTSNLGGGQEHLSQEPVLPIKFARKEAGNLNLIGGTTK